MSKHSYRCYFTDASDRIRSVEQIECEDDAAAALEVARLLAASQHLSAEVWLGKRLVGKWSNGKSSDVVSPSGEATVSGMLLVHRADLALGFGSSDVESAGNERRED